MHRIFKKNQILTMHIIYVVIMSEQHFTLAFKFCVVGLSARYPADFSCVFSVHIIPICTADYVRSNISLFQQANIVLTQLEIPIDTVEYVMSEGKKHNCITILNPAPVAELNPEIFKNIDIITPNEHELEKMTGINTVDDDGCRDAAKKLLSLGVKSVIVTRGEKGIFFINDSEEFFIAANKVLAVDTTAAGDAFLGGFASSLDLGGTIRESIDIGQKVAAYAIQQRGAQQSFPDRQYFLYFRSSASASHRLSILTLSLLPSFQL